MEKSSKKLEDWWFMTQRAPAENSKNCLLREIKGVEDETKYFYESDINCDPASKVKAMLIRLSSLESVTSLLNVAGNYWNRASYSSSSYSNNRKKAFEEGPNQPNDVAAVTEELANLNIKITIDDELMDSLTQKYSVMQMKYKKPLRYKPRSFAAQIGFGQQMVLNPRDGAPCRGSGCANIPAKNCANASCSKCCAGNCSRHSTWRV